MNAWRFSVPEDECCLLNMDFDPLKWLQSHGMHINGSNDWAERVYSIGREIKLLPGLCKPVIGFYVYGIWRNSSLISQWDGWMASPTQWTWVWVNSGSWWWTGRPGMLQSLVLQRAGHNWVTELNWSGKELVWMFIFIFNYGYYSNTILVLCF